RVAFSLITIDVIMSFCMFCCSLVESPCQRDNEVVGSQTGMKVLKLFKSLAYLLVPRFHTENPFKVFEDMSQQDEIVYCPFAYGYSNYSRPGYARKLLHFHDLVSMEKGGTPLISTLGGAGLAISSQSKHLDVAVNYARFVASPE